MKVIEIQHDARTNEDVEVSWGNVIESDLSVITSIANILEHQRWRESGESNLPPSLRDRFSTVAIRIEL